MDNDNKLRGLKVKVAEEEDLPLPSRRPPKEHPGFRYVAFVKGVRWGNEADCFYARGGPIDHNLVRVVTLHGTQWVQVSRPLKGVSSLVPLSNVVCLQEWGPDEGHRWDAEAKHWVSLVKKEGA